LRDAPEVERDCSKILAAGVATERMGAWQRASGAVTEYTQFRG